MVGAGGFDKGNGAGKRGAAPFADASGKLPDIRQTSAQCAALSLLLLYPAHGLSCILGRACHVQPRQSTERRNAGEPAIFIGGSSRGRENDPMSGIRKETTNEAVQKRRKFGNRAFPKLCLAAAIAFVAGTASGAATLPTASSGPKPDIKADYTVYIGGLRVAEGSMMATLGGETYLLENTLGSAGVAARFWDAHWTMTSKGTINEETVRPSLFEFSATEKSETKSREIRYDGRGVPSLTFEPPQSEEE